MTQQSPSLERSLPHSEDSERSILGGILLDNALITQAVEHLKPEDFYSPLNRRVYNAMIGLFEQSKQIDPVLIIEEMKKDGPIEAIGGISTIANLTFGLPHFSNIGEYVSTVLDKSKCRQLLRETTKIHQQILAEESDFSDILENAETALFALSNGNCAEQLFELGLTVDERIRVSETAQIDDPDRVTSGYLDLDRKLVLDPGSLTIIAARPSMGKTALSLAIAEHNAGHGRRVAIFSLEMETGQIIDRLIASRARVDVQEFRSGQLLSVQKQDARRAAQDIKKLRLIVDDSSSLSIGLMRAKLRRMAHKNKLGLVIVDYIQLMTSSQKKSESRRLEIEEISRGLKLLAKEFHVPVIALSQLSRAPEGRKPPRPMLSDLRESGSIEQDADSVLLIYRPEYYEPNTDKPAEIIVAKQRNGPTGTVELVFRKQCARFENVAKEGFEWQ